MCFILTLLILSATHSSDFLLKSSAEFSTGAQELCRRLLSPREEHAISHLLCGTRLPASPEKDLLRDASLLHLFVVSGAHLLWIDTVLNRLQTHWVLRFVVWGLYSAACGLQAPIVRAWMGLSLQEASGRWTPRLRGGQRAFLAGLTTLCLFPPWISSLSLAMSWTAALALSVPAPRSWRGDLLRCASVWLCMLPLLISWSPTSPLTILVNFFLAPFFSLVLFPLALIGAVVPPSLFIFDRSFEFFLKLLQILPLGSAVPRHPRTPDLWFCWAWILFLQIAFHILSVRIRRGRL